MNIRRYNGNGEPVYQEIMNNNNVYLASKPRYEILGGLRGVAEKEIIQIDAFFSAIITIFANKSLTNDGSKKNIAVPVPSDGKQQPRVVSGA